MGITLRQPGEAEATAKAGSIIGKAQRAEEERARAEREQVRAAEAKTRLKAQQMSMDWELQKMQINSQRVFERELRQEDYKLAAEDRAEAWQIEKMELASRMDFEREEGERQRKLSILDADETAWEKLIKDGQFTGNEPEYQNKLTEFQQRRRAIEMGETYQPGQLATQQRAKGRYGIAQEAATRAQEAHERKMAEAPETEEAIRRKQVIDVMGAAYRDVPLQEAEAEMRELGLMPVQTTQDANVPYPTPKSQAEYDAIPSGSTYIDSAGRERTKS